LLGSTGITNELPLSGSVKFISRQEEIEVDGAGAPTGVTRVTSQNVTENYAGVDTNSNVFTIQPIGSTQDCPEGQLGLSQSHSLTQQLPGIPVLTYPSGQVNSAQDPFIQV